MSFRFSLWQELKNRIEYVVNRCLTPGVIIPCLIIAGLGVFLFFELIFPAVRDYTAFYGVPAGKVDEAPAKSPSDRRPFIVSGRYGLFTEKNIYLITPLFDYEIKTRVLHKRRYYSNGNAADLMPFDLALGWRTMSDAATLGKYLIFHHGNSWGRYLRVELKKDWREVSPWLLREIEAGRDYSNNHLIPADDEAFAALENLKTGSIVRLSGMLVNVTRPDKPEWSWSTSRYDREDVNKYGKWGTGNSTDHMTTCDTIYVTKVEVISQ